LRQRKLVQWLNPVAGLALIAVSDWQSQQQRASQAAKGRVRRLLPARVSPVPAGALATAIAVGVLASRQRKQAGQNTPVGLGDAEVELGDAEVGDVEIDIVHVDLIDPSATRPPTPPPTPPTSGTGHTPPSRRLGPPHPPHPRARSSAPGAGGGQPRRFFSPAATKLAFPRSSTSTSWRSCGSVTARW